MAKLEIENVEIFVHNKIVLSKAVYSLSDWFSKSVTFSERVVCKRVPFMKFGQYYTFKYSDNGKILFNGVAILISREQNKTDEIQLLDTSIQLFNSLDNELTALDMDSEDFIFNISAYSTLKVLNSSIWLWAAANNYENRTLSNNILSGRLSYSRPFFSVLRLLEKAFGSNNWTFATSSNADLFNRLIMSSNADSFYFTSYEKVLNETVTGGIRIDITNPYFIKTDTVSGSYTLRLTYKSVMRFRGYITSDAELTLKINGLSSESTDRLDQAFVINKGRVYYNLTSNEFETIDTTYNILFEIEGSGSATFEDFYIYTLVNENDFGAITQEFFTDFKVKAYDNIKSITQKDLFKHALVLIGGFFTTNNLRKEIQVNSLNELSKLSAKDWTSKFVEQSDKKTQVPNYGKLNYFNYNNTDNSSLGRGTFAIDNNTYKDLINIYTSEFEASGEVIITDTQIDKVYYDSVGRIATSNELIGYYENVGAYTVARYKELNGDSILKSYYQNFVEAIQKGEIIEAQFILNNSDFFDFKFLNLVYIKQLKSTYYIIDINGFIDNEPSKLILLKA